MSKGQVISFSKPRLQIDNSRSSSFTKNTRILAPLTESKKLINKNLSMYLSPYSSSHHLNSSFDRPLEQSLTKPISKEHQKTFQRKSQKNLHTLNSLIDGERTPDKSKISKRLLKKLQDLYESVDYIDVYLDVLDEVILYDKDFAKVLSTLKNRFSAIFNTQQLQVQTLSKSFRNIQVLNNSLETEKTQLALKSQELQLKLDDAYEKYTEISDKYLKMTKISIDAAEFTEENFKKIKQESFLFKDLIFKMEDEIKFYKRKSKRFCRLLNVLETKGIPVEEIYVTEMKKKKKLPNYEGISEAESCTDNENILSNRDSSYKKPLNVPSLSLFELQPSSSSSASSLTPNLNS